MAPVRHLAPGPEVKLPEKPIVLQCSVPPGRLKGEKMRKPMLFTALLLAGLCGALPGLAQETKKAPPKPAPGPADAVLEQWNEIGRKLIAMAEDFPEDKYDYKPAASMRSFAERLIHAAAANYFFTNSALGQKLPGDEDPARSKFKDKAAVVAYIKKSFADGASAIQLKGDKGI